MVAIRMPDGKMRNPALDENGEMRPQRYPPALLPPWRGAFPLLPGPAVRLRRGPDLIDLYLKRRSERLPFHEAIKVQEFMSGP